MSCMAGTRPFRRFLDWMERLRGHEVIFRGVGDEQQMWPIAVRSCRSKRNGANGHVFVQCV